MLQNIRSKFMFKKNSFSQITTFVALVLVVLGMFISPLASAKLNAKSNLSSLPILDRVVATVNNEAIPESELNQQLQMLVMRFKQSDTNLPPEDVLRKQLLEKIVLEKLQLQMAKEEKINIDDKDVDKALQQIAGRDNMNVTELQKVLEDQGLPFKQFRQTIKNEMIISKLQQKEIGQFITISATELDHFIQSPQGQDQTGSEYHLGHILIALPENPSQKEAQAAEKKAKDIMRQLQNGADFKKVAMANSSGPQALNGGDLGWRKSQELPTLFAKNVPSLAVNEVKGPIKNSSGFHIVKLIEKRISGEPTENMVRNRAMDALYQRKFEEQLSVWLRRVRDEAQIETQLDAG